MFSGQIMVLLGHNGAGKTTAINILTGMFPPTAGTASINSHDILKETKQARKNLGLCPQHNVLYDTLTVEEHLKFFGGLKGMAWKDMNSEVTTLLNLLRLQDKRYSMSKELSGGMKRKLSLGIAIFGGSQVLILDEPTSGMDPETRRMIWDTLQKLRHNRTILLTTHFMEEADALGDRIAIMANGSVFCCGSPIFLKGKFGTGYHLHVAKTDDCDVKEITKTIHHYIPEAKLISNINLELSYSLSSESTNFSNLFEKLESSFTELGIASCGVTVTTMEDVFLNVNDMVEKDLDRESHLCDDQPLINHVNNTEPKLICSSKLLDGKLILQQMKSLFLKRLHYGKRHWSVLIFQILIPVIAFCIMVYLDFVIHKTSESNNLISLDLNEIYGKTEGFSHSQNNSEIANYYKNTLIDESVNVTTLHADPNEYLLKKSENNLKSYIENDLVGGSISENDDISIISWFNGVPHHVDPISINLVTSSLLRHITKDNKSNIEISNHPLPGSVSFNIQKMMQIKLGRMLFILFVPIALTFLSSSFVLFPIHERVSKAKLLQRMCGVNGITHWMMNLSWDYLIYMICCVLLIIPLIVYSQLNKLMDTTAVGAMFVMLLINGWPSISLTYIFSFIPNVPSTGFALLSILNMFSGMILCIIILFLSYLSNVSQQILYNLIWLLRFFPNFSVSWGIGKIYTTTYTNNICNDIDKNMLNEICKLKEITRNIDIFQCCPSEICENSCIKRKEYLIWDEDQSGRECLMLIIDGFFYFTIIILLETILPKLWHKFLTSMKKELNLQKVESIINVIEDSDVTEEHNRVENLFHCSQINEEALVSLNLKKCFKHFCAVNNLTFAVHKKECFGLLGINGAGKTTIFRMLTGDLIPTQGNAYIEDNDIQQKLQKFQTSLGYCPQFDALIDRLTGREMLTLFANLRGIPSNDIPCIVNNIITMCDLEKHVDKVTEQYSGGTKRKLSLGLALIGAPPVVLLDEPTTGVDPISRRKIWETLVTMKQLLGISFILTSHSMDECEALCSRIAIMVNGRFRCLGSMQHLKSKYGQGYTLIIKMKQAVFTNIDKLQEVKMHIENVFPSAILKDEHQGILHYHVTDISLKWSKMFSIMETTKQKFELEDYIVSGTTLEQIFLAFAQGQQEQQIS